MKKEREQKKTKPLIWSDVLNQLRTKPTVSLPVAGFALADLSKNASYANKDKLGVPVLETEGRYRVPSIFVLRLGIEPAENNPQQAT